MCKGVVTRLSDALNGLPGGRSSGDSGWIPKVLIVGQACPLSITLESNETRQDGRKPDFDLVTGFLNGVSSGYSGRVLEASKRQEFEGLCYLAILGMSMRHGGLCRRRRPQRRC